MLKKNQEIELTCEALGAELEGVCRYEGQAVFVPGALPGEKLRGKVVRAEKRYAFARVEALREPSPERREAPCKQYPRCGGCAALHMQYETTLRAKRQKVYDCLTRIGGFESPVVRETLGMDSPWRYRNKGAFPVAGERGNVKIGCFAARSHAVVDAPDGCLLQTETSDALVRAVREWANECGVAPYDEERHAGLLRHVMTREAADGTSMLILVVNGRGVPQLEKLVSRAQSAAPGLRSVILSENTARTNVILGPVNRAVWGESHLTETLCGFSMRVSAPSFFQVNRAQAERLCEKAVEFAALTGKERVWDLYCGCGTITLPLSRHAQAVLGIEIVPEAVEDARENAARNGVSNAQFACAAVEDEADTLVRRLAPDVVVLDPPRKGAEASALEAVARANPERIVYVSCNPATLARDAKLLAEKGYTLREAVPVDMFPWTAHVETVAWLSRENG